MNLLTNENEILQKLKVRYNINMSFNVLFTAEIWREVSKFIAESTDFDHELFNSLWVNRFSDIHGPDKAYRTSSNIYMSDAEIKNAENRITKVSFKGNEYTGKIIERGIEPVDTGEQKEYLCNEVYTCFYQKLHDALSIDFNKKTKRKINESFKTESRVLQAQLQRARAERQDDNIFESGLQDIVPM